MNVWTVRKLHSILCDGAYVPFLFIYIFRVLISIDFFLPLSHYVRQKKTITSCWNLHSLTKPESVKADIVNILFIFPFIQNMFEYKNTFKFFFSV